MRRVPAVLVLVALAGCGGGEQGGDPAVYARTGDRICTEYEQAIAKLGQPKALDELGPFIERALPVLRRTVERLEKLDPPGERRDDYETFRDAARETVDRAQALRQAAADADAEEVQRLLDEAAKASERRKELAADAGLKACAEL